MGVMSGEIKDASIEECKAIDVKIIVQRAKQFNPIESNISLILSLIKKMAELQVTCILRFFKAFLPAMYRLFIVITVSSSVSQRSR
jgi:hypothetical protein